MAESIDYLVTAVRYAGTTTHISHVMVYINNGQKNLMPGSAWSREEVINAINLNATFYTFLKDANNNWTIGAKIEKVHIGGEWFIKTDPGNTKKDNLGNLPGF